MSLFRSFMGDFEDDPIYGSHMQSMRQFSNMMNSMNSMFADPFGMMGAPMLGPNQNMPSIMGPNQNMQPPGMQMMPFGFPQMPNMTQMFSSFNNMGDPNCHSYSSSSIMTMTSSPDGRPQVYQESMSTRCAPGGVRETKKTVSDSMSGVKKMAIGHHIGERAHILEREQNIRSGDQEERQEFINLDEDEAESFNHEWTTKTRQNLGAIRAPNYRPNDYNYQDHEVLALPSNVRKYN